MRIAYLCPDLGIPLDGTKGASAHVRGLISAMLREGHDVVVLAAAGHDPELGAPLVPIRTPAVASASAAFMEARLGRALAHLWTNSAVEAALSDVAASHWPDLVYERYSPFSAAGALTALRLGIPHMLEVNAPLVWEGEQYRRQALPDVARALENAAFSATGRIVAVSRELKSMLVAQGVPAMKIVVVPNGVDLSRFTPDGEAWTAPQPGAVVVGFVGSLKPWHGIELLADSFRRAAVHRPELHLLVVGDGPEAKKVDALSRELPGRVSRFAVVDHADVPRYLRGVDVAVAPYMPLERFYYSPLKILEYMAAGRAIVASGLGQVSELLTHGEDALLVAPGDSEGLTDALVRLAGDAGLRQRLGTAVRDAAQAHGWDARVTDILHRARAAA